MGAHILIVEDDEMVQGFMRLHLENEGYRVTAVATGGEIATVLQSSDVDLIILDLGLPDGDGIARQHDLRGYSNVPVVIATARQGVDDRVMALGIGADHYVSKPYDPRELLLRVQNVLNRTKTAAVADAAPTPAPPVAPQLKPSRPQPEPGVTLPPAQGVERRKGGGSGALVWAAVVAAVVAVLVGGGYWLMQEPAPQRQAAVAPAPGEPPKTSQPVPPRAEQAATLSAERPPKPAEPAAEGEEPTVIRKPEPDRAVTVTPAPIQPDPVPTAPVGTPSVTPPQGPKDPDVASVRPLAAGSYSWVLRSKCDKLPDIEWWRFKTHLDIVRYVNCKHGGDWNAYLSDWRKRYENLKAIHDRKSGVRTSSGAILTGETLARYVADTAVRLAITQCLSAEAQAYEHQKMRSAQ